jgi:hypothetical protein
MEAELIQTTVDPDKELVDVIKCFRGPIVDAHDAYPDVLHVEVRDGDGGLWRFATQDATWSPTDPAAFLGRSVIESSVDARTGELRCELSDGSVFTVTPAAQEAPDDPPNWELFTPDGQMLDFGPGMRWRLVDLNELD